MTLTYDYLKEGFKVERPELETQIYPLLATNTWEINLTHLIVTFLT